MSYIFNKGNIKIHLKSKRGVYGVTSIGKDTITCQTKHYSFRTPKSDFKCFAGGYKPSEKQADYFKALLSESNLQKQLDVVKYKLQNELVRLKKDEANMKYQVDDYYGSLEKNLDILQKKLIVQKEEHEKEMKEMMQEKIVNSDEMRTFKLNKAGEVYQHPIDLSNFENHDGIKFIIQEDKSETSYKMFFDPFQFVDNYHSSLTQITESISEKTDGEYWRTINGGWLKVIGDAVILYGRSGDYGVYNDDIAIECAKKLFPGKQIYSYADCIYDSGMNEGKPEKLRSFYNGHEFTDKKFLNSSFKLGEKFDAYYDVKPIKKYHVPKRGVTEDNKSFLKNYRFGDEYIIFVDGQPCFIEDRNSYYTFNFYDPKDLK
jgi:hypothetical protein